MIVLIYLLISVSCLSDSDLNILSLNKDSFPNIFKSHQHLIIMFYQPWYLHLYIGAGSHGVSLLYSNK